MDLALQECRTRTKELEVIWPEKWVVDSKLQKKRGRNLEP